MGKSDAECNAESEFNCYNGWVILFLAWLQEFWSQTQERLMKKKRFTVALQKEGQDNCYVHQMETDSELQAITKANKFAAEHGRVCVVIDNHTFDDPFIYRTDKVQKKKRK